MPNFGVESFWRWMCILALDLFWCWIAPKVSSWHLRWSQRMKPSFHFFLYRSQSLFGVGLAREVLWNWPGLFWGRGKEASSCTGGALADGLLRTCLLWKDTLGWALACGVSWRGSCRRALADELSWAIYATLVNGAHGRGPLNGASRGRALADRLLRTGSCGPIFCERTPLDGLSWWAGLSQMGSCG